MSKHYGEVWSLIEQLDGVTARLSDMLDGEKDRHARPRLQEAISHIEEAVSSLEDVDPDKEDDSLRDGEIVIGYVLKR